MSELFKDEYRIPSSRWYEWNYSSSAVYFITICTYNHNPFFGAIIDGHVVPNDLGSFLSNEWLKTPMFRPEMNIRLDEFVVMPNHFHGIISICGNENKDRVSSASRFGPQSNNLSSIVRGVKASVSGYAKKHGIAFQWQSRFYDHIIRDDDDFDRIRAYIVNNPLNWDKDEYNF